MAFLDEIAEWVLTAGLADFEPVPDDPQAASLWALCKAFMPEQPDRVVLLSEYAGNPPQIRADVDYPGLQVRVRGRGWEYGEARDKSEAVRVALHGLGPVSINSRRYVHFEAQQSVTSLGRDANDRPEFTCNFIVIRSR